MKKRYLALKAEGNQSFGEREMLDAVWNMVFTLFGEVGASQTDLRLVRGFDIDVKGVAVVQCSLGGLRLVRAAVAAVTEVGGVRGMVRVVEISGTLKGLWRKLHERFFCVCG